MNCQMMKKLIFDDLDTEFKEKILDKNPKSNSSNILIYSEQKRVLLKQDEEHHYIGCELCIKNEIKNNKLGYPCIDNQDLVCFIDLQEENSLPRDVALNIWHCPVCHKILIKPPLE